MHGSTDSAIRCPLTGSTDVDLIAESSAERIAALWKAKYGLDIGRELDRIRSVRRYRSNATGLEFFLPAAAMGSGWLYEQLDRVPGYYSADRWEHDVALDDLAGVDSVLEIGCGDGAFAARVGAAFGISAHGLEVNMAAAERAAKRGLKVSTRSLRSFAAGHPRKYGAVCAFQVLEHAADPLAFLRAALRLVRDSGKLLLSVPNCASFIRHDAENVLDLPPHHMTRWSLEVFEHLARLLPVRVERSAFEPLAAYHVGWYAQVATRGQWFCRRRQHALKRRLRSAAEREKLRGHTLYVCLTKTPGAA